jgi:DNA polymerase I-like protein with 3'-5' exonuclease and polymerase domains
MQSYCEQDTRVTYRLWTKIQSKNYSEQAIQLEHDFAQILFLQEQRGFKFDAEAGRMLYAELCKKRLDLEEQLQAVFPPWEERTPFTPKVNNAKRGYQKCVTIEKVKVVAFNPNSRDHIANRLQALRGWQPTEYTEDGKPKVDEAVLEKLDWPEAKLLAEYLMLQKRIGQLAEGAQAWLKLERNGRIHGQVVTNGAVTGRCTHKYPNITQVPAKGVSYGHECRSLFTPTPGFVLLGCDASGLELRCLAHYMAKYDGGRYTQALLESDIHITNQIAAGLPTREQAKRFIYAFLYGAGDTKLGTIIGAGAKEGRLLKNRFLKRTPALKRLKQDISEKVAKQGFLKGLDGRLLHIRSEHSALNTLLQSAGALLVKQATIFLYQELTEQGYVWGKDWAQVAHVHDELQLEVKPELAETIGQIAMRCFERAGEYFNFRCPITGEYRIGQSWAETH